MSEPNRTIAETLPSLGADQGELSVALSNELVQLLSDQLYQSPLKAIEELVVNSYDAEAKTCRVYVPELVNEPAKFVVVYDDGIGMDKEGLEDLWHIGRSNKRSEEIEARAHRKQIGKFGIGKLATYAIANRITYVTRKTPRYWP
jgi:HSP90 family molecular chaperone